MKKYELTSEYVEFDGRKLYKIKALKSFYLCGLTVKAGALGGYVEKEENLSQEGNAWIHGNAYVYDNAYVRDNAYICEEAWIHGNVEIKNEAWIHGNAEISGNAKVKDEAEVYGDAEVCDNAEIRDNAKILGDARIGGKAQIYGKAKVMRGAVVHANAEILGDAQIQGVVNISQDARICSDEDYAAVQGFRTKFKFATFYRTKDEKVMVYCGDFNGNLEGFREWAKKTFDGKNQKEYLTIADFMEQHFAPEKEED